MKKQRNIIRIIHLIGAAAIGTFVYSPFSNLEWLKLVMQIGIIPVLSFSGIWLWKPKWFSFMPGAKIITLALIAGVATLIPTQTYAQEADSNVQLRGGAGGFYTGYKSFDAGDLDFFLPLDASSFENGLIQIGGDGYFFINRLIIGGGGHYTQGDNFSLGGNRYRIDGGGGYFTIGYCMLDKNVFILYPYTNIGIEALSMEKGMDANVDYDVNQYTEMNYVVASPTLDLGFGGDWFVFKKSLKLGAKIGYQFALNQSPEWFHTPGNTVNSPDIPDLGLNGFHFRLSIGGGYIN